MPSAPVRPAVDPVTPGTVPGPDRSHSRAQRFTVVLLIELWERFGYYGMQALLLLFLVERLGFPDSRANLLWGAFAALTYAAPAIGGWLGDQVLGSRRAAVVGACCLMAGYAVLAIPGDAPELLFLGMGAISTGNGLFKPNAANLVRRIYEGDDARLDAAFTLYYMAVNIGSTASLLLSPAIKDRLGWHAGFGVSALGLLLGLGAYSVLRGRLSAIGSRPDFAPLPPSRAVAVGVGMVASVLAITFILQHPAVARACVWIAGLAVLGAWSLVYVRVPGAERPGLLASYLLTLQVMLYFIFYQQQSTSLTLFTLRNVDPTFRIGGTALFSLSAGQFQALNPIWIMVLSPILAALYNALGRSGRDLRMPTKYLVGFCFVSGAFVIWWLFTGAGAPAHVTPWAMVAGYGSISLGELLISGLSLAMIARYTPQRLSAFMMGGLFVAYGIALYVGSILANLAALPPELRTAPPEQTLPLYHALFGHLLELGLAATVASLVLLPVLRGLDRRHRLHVEAAAAS
ncbi:MAG: MFS transporter [Gluconacetobacter diazotrophicus]|nr:MFS transporter [Gluconacetobacter diazotrophicus]